MTARLLALLERGITPKQMDCLKLVIGLGLMFLAIAIDAGRAFSQDAGIPSSEDI